VPQIVSCTSLPATVGAMDCEMSASWSSNPCLTFAMQGQSPASSPSLTPRELLTPREFDSPSFMLDKDAESGMRRNSLIAMYDAIDHFSELALHNENLSNGRGLTVFFDISDKEDGSTAAAAVDETMADAELKAAQAVGKDNELEGEEGAGRAEKRARTGKDDEDDFHNGNAIEGIEGEQEISDESTGEEMNDDDEFGEFEWKAVDALPYPAVWPRPTPILPVYEGTPHARRPLRDSSVSCACFVGPLIALVKESLRSRWR